MVVFMDVDSNEDIPGCCDRDEKDISPIAHPFGALHQYSDDSGRIDELSSIQSSMSERDVNIHGDSSPPLFQLPPELLQQILSYFSAQDLARVSATCHVLAEHATNELLWSNLVNSYLPFKIHDPGPFDSFRQLYIAHHPCWFIPRNKIWFSDREHTGNLILARYDNRRGVIEAYRIVAERRTHHFQVWNWNPDVMIQTFHPKVRLWMDDPVLLLKKDSSGSPGRPRCLNGEIRMPMALEAQNVFSSFSLCSTEIPAHVVTNPTKQWPPVTIPSDRRVYRDVDDHLPEWYQPPQRTEQISESAFRLRKWPHFGMGVPFFSTGDRETLATYATLDPSLYTPTKEKPYQGIWVGDYSAHGCEFLLFLQRDFGERPTTPSTSSTTYEPSELNESDGSEAETEDIINQGSLEAIKLTGDPNVPRGELSFIAEDIGRDGMIRTADEPLFQGARIVHSMGHVAGLGFRDGKPLLPKLLNTGSN